MFLENSLKSCTFSTFRFSLEKSQLDQPAVTNRKQLEAGYLISRFSFYIFKPSTCPRKTVLGSCIDSYILLDDSQGCRLPRSENWIPGHSLRLVWWGRQQRGIIKIFKFVLIWKILSSLRNLLWNQKGLSRLGASWLVCPVVLIGKVNLVHRDDPWKVNFT